MYDVLFTALRYQARFNINSIDLKEFKELCEEHSTNIDELKSNNYISITDDSVLLTTKTYLNVR